MNPWNSARARRTPSGQRICTNVFLKCAIRVRGDFEPTTWDAFERIWCLGRPAPEVARSLGMTIDAVYAAKSRILKRLREEVLLLADDLPMALSPR